MTQHEPSEQLTLDLEFQEHTEYTIRLCQDDDYDVIVIDETKTRDRFRALSRVDEYLAAGKASGVTWSDNRVGGRIFGVGPGGIVHYVTIFPTINTPLVQQ